MKILSVAEISFAVVGAGYLVHKVYTVVDLIAAKAKVVTAALKAKPAATTTAAK